MGLKLRTARALALAALAALALAPPAAVGGQVPAGTEDSYRDVASYDLSATLDAGAKRILGSGRATYRNLSPDTLHEVWLHLYLNAFASPETPWMRAADAGFRGVGMDPMHPGGIQLLRLDVDGSPAPAETLAARETEVRVPLLRPLPPGGELTLDLAWEARLPRVFARTGFAGDFVLAGQWYPKLAVYDRGRWNSDPWHPYAEFFADFGRYDLVLTVPAGYVTGASGQPLAERLHGDGSRTVHYRAERVTDIAWTAWPRFQRMDRGVVVAGRQVDIEVLFPPGADEDGQRHLAATVDALDQFGRLLGPYPWPRLTVVVPPPEAEGAGGMEYPSFVTTSPPSPMPFGLGRGIRLPEVTTYHEVAHQWLPLQVQTNEAAEPWLDEGFADYLTARAMAARFGPTRSFLDLPFARLGYAHLHRFAFAGSALREPLGRPARDYGAYEVYGATVYSKASLVLQALEGYLGQERFDTALRTYMDHWRWRHPTGADFQRTMEEAAGTDLAWLFDGYVYGAGVAEYAVDGRREDRPGVERLGDVPHPVTVRIRSASGAERDLAWDGRGTRLDLPEVGGERPRALVIDPEGRLAIQASRLDDAWMQPSDDGAALEVAARWQGLVQLLLQALGRLG